MLANKPPTICPDCHQPTDQPQKPCGWLGCDPVWCTTCEQSDRICLDEAPDPVPVEYLRALAQRAGSQRKASEIVRVGVGKERRDYSRFRDWCAGQHPIPWAVAELLRIKLSEPRQ